MILLEYQAKRVLKGVGFSVPDSFIVRDQSSPIQCSLPAVVKAQTPFGGRLLSGGIRFVNSETELEEAVSDLLSLPVKGYSVDRVLVEDRLPYQSELYVSISYDNHLKSPVLIVSLVGGIDIEKVAITKPEALWKLVLDARRDVLQHHLIEWLAEKGLKGKELLDLSQLLRKLIQCFFEWDALLLEINPLVKTYSGDYYILDCHLEIDDDAGSRDALKLLLGNDEVLQAIGKQRQTPFEARAKAIDEIDYRGVAGRLIDFPGTLGLLIGGGGASLTIFDAVLRHQGSPANYCEIGGNPTAEKIAKLTELIITQPRVAKLAVIMNVVNNTRADLIAEGVISGIKDAKKNPKDVIVMFRVPGSGEERCREILKANDIAFTDRSVTVDEAALIAVEAARGNTHH